MPEGYITIFCCGAGVVIGFVLAAWGMFAVFLRQDDCNAPKPKKRKRAKARPEIPAQAVGPGAFGADAETAAEAAAETAAEAATEPVLEPDQETGISDSGNVDTEPAPDHAPGDSGQAKAWDPWESARQGAAAEPEDAAPATGAQDAAPADTGPPAKKKRRRKKRGKHESAASRLNGYGLSEPWTSFAMDFGEEDFDMDMEDGLSRQGAAYAATAHKATRAMDEARRERKGD